MKNEKFKKICHFFAGVILLPVAFKLFEQKKFIACLILFFFGIFFIILSAALDWVEKTIGNVVKLSFLLESLLLFFTAFIQLDAGKKKPTILYASVAVVYFLIFLYYLYGKEKSRRHKHKHHHHHHHKHRKKHHSDDANDEAISATN